MSRLKSKFAVKVCSQSQQLKILCVKKSTKIKFLCVKKSTKIKFLRVKKSTKIKFLWVEKVCNLQMCHPKVPRPLRKILKAQGPYKAPTRPLQGPSDHQGPGALKAPKIIKVPGTL